MSKKPENKDQFGYVLSMVLFSALIPVLFFASVYLAPR